jgi:hypothetical protein
MNGVEFARQAIKSGHEWLEGTMADVTPEQAHWIPPGVAHPIGALYAHVLTGEDMLVHAMLKQAPPLFASSWAGKTGLSEPMPMPGPEWGKHAQWARSVKVDLPQLKAYAQAVYAATDEYLATLTDADLSRPFDMTSFGMGMQTVGWVIGLLLINHIGTETGEISCAKGLQGLKGYPG